MTHFDGYRVELAPADGEYVASLLELPTITAYGETPEKAIIALSQAYTLSKSAMVSRGYKLPDPISARDFSGRFNVRVSKRLHEELVIEAEREGITLNAVVNHLLSRQIFSHST